jgi:hypothetical protein
MITIFPVLSISTRAICTPAAVTALTALVTSCCRNVEGGRAMASYREAFSSAGSWSAAQGFRGALGPAGNLSQVPGNRSLCVRKVRKVRKVGKVLGVMTGTTFLTFLTFLA